MIEVVIRHKESGGEIGRIEIENVSGPGEVADYAVKFGVDRITSVGLHKRPILGFPRTKYNVLALVLQALNTLDPRELELDHDAPASDLSRKAIKVGNLFRRGH